MLRISLLAGFALLAVACSGSDGVNEEKAARGDGFAMAGSPPPPPPAPAMAPQDVAATGNLSRSEVQIIQQDPNSGGGQPAPPGTMMAYTYSWTFKVPPNNLEDLLNAHKKACEDAGPSKCYVVNSGVSGLGEESSYGNLNLRASEDWVRSFEKGVDAGLKPFDASVDASSRSGEDLTVQIVDGEARLKSQVAFRDGLQAMLRDKPGKLSDLLEIQRTLADAQADIDSRQSVLAALKLRVAMSTIGFDYRPKLSAVSESIWRPLGEAFSNFAPNFVSTLANIVEFIGGILPIVIFGGLGIWLVMLLFQWFGRRRRKKLVPAAPAPKPAAGG